MEKIPNAIATKYPNAIIKQNPNAIAKQKQKTKTKTPFPFLHSSTGFRSILCQLAQTSQFPFSFPVFSACYISTLVGLQKRSMSLTARATDC